MENLLNLKLSIDISDVPKIGQRFFQSASASKIEPKSVCLEPITLKPIKIENIPKRTHTLLEYQFAALNMNNGNLIPPSIQPPASNQRIEEPGKDERKNIDTPVSSIVNEIMEKISDNNKGDMDLPPLEGQNESIEAAVMIEIRRLKMKKHKYKKLQKKMKFEFAKRKLRRKMKREKEFQADLLAQINAADKFSAEQYVADKLAQLKNVPPPKREIVRIF